MIDNLNIIKHLQHKMSTEFYATCVKMNGKNCDAERLDDALASTDTFITVSIPGKFMRGKGKKLNFVEKGSILRVAQLGLARNRTGDTWFEMIRVCPATEIDPLRRAAPLRCANDELVFTDSIDNI